MIIEMDTDILREASLSTKSANDMIDQVAALINQIVVHNDWICDERETINEYVTENQNQVRYLQSCVESLYRAVLDCLAHFEAAQEETANSFNTIDDLIAGVLSLTPGTISANNQVSGSAVAGLWNAGLSDNTSAAPNLCSFDTIESAMNE